MTRKNRTNARSHTSIAGCTDFGTRPVTRLSRHMRMVLLGDSARSFSPDSMSIMLTEGVLCSLGVLGIRRDADEGGGVEGGAFC
mmetsp:Transcript_8707/g.28657  ORF Transcript_8707/g.28657 Transcript_8707/m.28657 type:complete len:84 (+) Transcript_8707:576-827(+)